MLCCDDDTPEHGPAALAVLGCATGAAVVEQAAAAGGGFLGMGSTRTPGLGTGLLRFVIRFVARFVTLSRTLFNNICCNNTNLFNKNLSKICSTNPGH